jgi:hypothetical protein
MSSFIITSKYPRKPLKHLLHVLSFQISFNLLIEPIFSKITNHNKGGKKLYRSLTVPWENPAFAGLTRQLIASVICTLDQVILDCKTKMDKK